MGLSNLIDRLKWTRAALKALIRLLMTAHLTPMRPERRAFALSAASTLALVAAGCASIGAVPPPSVPAPSEGSTPAYDRLVEQRAQEPEQNIRLPAFPWPPPQPSSQMLIERSRFANDRSFGGVAARLEIALRACGHLRSSYYEAPGGFALVTQIERLRDGARTYQRREERFVNPTAGAAGTYDFLGFIQSLWFAPTGYYRQIVFIVTDKPFAATEAPPTVEVANRLLGGGLGYLPPNYARREFSANHRVEALIYEFQKQGDARAEVARPARWNARTHLQRLGLLREL